MYPCHIFKSVGRARFLLTSATQRLKTVCNMINERKNCTAAPGGGGREATVVKVGGISSSHQILCISSRPRVTLQSREFSFESHFPFLGAQFNAIPRPTSKFLISYFSHLISHFQLLISHFPFLPSHFQLLLSHFI